MNWAISKLNMFMRICKLFMRICEYKIKTQPGTETIKIEELLAVIP